MEGRVNGQNNAKGETMKKFMIAAAVVIAAGLSGAAEAQQDKVKAGFIYIGPTGDFGWTYQHDQGRKYIEQQLGDKAETIFIESVPEGPDAERAIERLARSGADIIFTTSFGYMDPTVKVAKKFPKVKFEHATGYKRTDNVSTYSSRFYEGRYVIGQIAAKTSKSGVAGYIASFPIPEVVRGINSFILGAQSVNPDFKLKVIWVNSWFDPGKEADAAKALVDQGVDIITQHTDSPAAMQVAEERGINAFGQASDMIKFGPSAQLTSIVDFWGDYYAQRVKAVLDGTWQSADTWGGFAADMVHMAAYTNMPDDVKKMAEETQAKITSGELHPFQGPIFKQDGTQVIGEGVVLDDGVLLGMNYYVKGIDGDLP
jgi:simple sugar transport system substrate-binding protein